MPRWNFDRSRQSSTRDERARLAAPTSGQWYVGDRCRNRNPMELGSGSSKYVIEGWICIASGAPGTWVERRTLTGN